VPAMAAVRRAVRRVGNGGVAVVVVSHGAAAVLAIGPDSMTDGRRRADGLPS
jgi:hypothetical protein